MVKRILAAWYLVGQDKGYPTATFNSWKIGSRDVGGANHKGNVRAMARDGIVLLKNTGAALPLKKPKSIAVIGSDAIVDPKGMNNCAGKPVLSFSDYLTYAANINEQTADATVEPSQWDGEAAV
jgi:beta-glucosidase